MSILSLLISVYFYCMFDERNVNKLSVTITLKKTINQIEQLYKNVHIYTKNFWQEVKSCHYLRMRTKTKENNKCTVVSTDSIVSEFQTPLPQQKNDIIRLIWFEVLNSHMRSKHPHLTLHILNVYCQRLCLFKNLP